MENTTSGTRPDIYHENYHKIRNKINKTKFRWLKEAIDHWEGIVSETEMGCDWSEAAIMCWRCGCERMTQRCHMVPKSLGGGDGPENIVALCAMCHDENPNVADSDAMWSWIKKTGNSNYGGTYNTYWYARAMKSIALQKGLTIDEIASKVDLEKLKNNMKKTGFHFGQSSGGSRLTLSTIEWAINTSIDQ
jgi:hypothetical protein